MVRKSKKKIDRSTAEEKTNAVKQYLATTKNEKIVSKIIEYNLGQTYRTFNKLHSNENKLIRGLSEFYTNEWESGVSTVSFRLENYLKQYMEVFSNATEANLSDVLRFLLNITLAHPWILEDYINGELLDQKSIEEFQQSITLLSTQLNEFMMAVDKSFDAINEQLKAMESTTQLLQSQTSMLNDVEFVAIKQKMEYMLEDNRLMRKTLERILGLNLEGAISAPDSILERNVLQMNYDLDHADE